LNIILFEELDEQKNLAEYVSSTLVLAWIRIYSLLGWRVSRGTVFRHDCSRLQLVL
jgi:hypothetical protein